MLRRTANARTLWSVLALVLLGVFSLSCDIATIPLGPVRRQTDLITSDTIALIQLQPGIRHQTITGWEAHAESGYESPDFPLFRDSLFSSAVNDLGINRLRVEIKSGAENTQNYYLQWRRGVINDSTWRCVRFATVNDNSDPNVINWAGFKFSALDTIVQNVVLPMRQQLAARGENLFINLTYVAFTNQICGGRQYDHDNSPREYAEFILATSLHLRNKYGLTPDAWEVILEPDNTSFWRGKQIGDAIVATATRLAANGFTPRFITPSTARTFNAVPYFDQMVVLVPAVKPYLRELSYHRYSTPTFTELQMIAARAAQHGIRPGMLEHIGSGHEDLHNDLKHAKVTAWQQFALAFGAGDGGAQYYRIDRTVPTNPKVIMGSRTKFLRQYFRFVRAGAVRIEATSSKPEVDPVAFINPNGKYVVTLKSTATVTKSFTVKGLPAGTYGVTFTTSSANILNRPDIVLGAGQFLNSRVPPRAVLTIYQK